MQLESFCQFHDQEYKHIIKYINTKWLSLEALSVACWDSSHRLRLTFYQKKINHHDLKGFVSISKIPCWKSTFVLPVFIKSFYKAQSFTTKRRPLVSACSRSYSKISEEIGLEVIKS